MLFTGKMARRLSETPSDIPTVPAKKLTNRDAVYRSNNSMDNPSHSDGVPDPLKIGSPAQLC